MAATTIGLPLLDEARQEHNRVLNEAYLETRIYASGASADDADDLYEAAMEVLDAKEYDSEDLDRLKQARDMFIWSARDRLDQE